MDSEKLKKKFIRGNKRAFDIIYKDYSAAMYSVCQRYTRNTDEAADILQDAFVKIYQKRELFNPQFSIGPWIKKIVMNEAINHYRLNRKFQLIENESYFEEEDEQLYVEDEGETLKKALMEVLNEPPAECRIGRLPCAAAHGDACGGRPTRR